MGMGLLYGVCGTVGEVRMAVDHMGLSSLADSNSVIHPGVQNELWI